MSDTGRGVGQSLAESRRAAAAMVARIAPPRRRAALGVAAGLALVLVLVALRVAGADRGILLGWTWVACAVALVSPFTGLVVLAGVLPFSEWAVFGTVVGAKSLLIPFAVAGTFLRPLHRPGAVPRAVSLGVALAAVTGAGVLITAARFDAKVTEAALHGWVAGIGGGLALFAIAWRTARGGSVAPVVVALAAVSVGAALSLAEFLAPGIVRGGPLGVLLRAPLDELPRVTGIIPAPNAVATLFAATVAVVVPLLVGRPRRVGAAGWLLVAMLVAATVFTYSRSGIISLVAVAILAIWARNRRWAAVITVGTIVAMAVLLPVFLVLRSQLLASDASIDLLGALRGDALRFEGWVAALRMFRASPVVGHGFGSFRELAFNYGSNYVTAPHNELLRLFAEGGLLAGGVATAFLGVLLATLWRRRDAWGRAGLGALIALVVGGMFNNPFIYVQVVGPVLLMVGSSLGAARSQGPRQQPPDQPVAAAPAASAARSS